MIEPRLFRRYYGVTVAIVLSFALLGFLGSRIVLHMNPPPIGVMRVYVLDGSGNVLEPLGAPLPLRWDEIEKPTGSYETRYVPFIDASGMHHGRATLTRLPGEPVRFLVVGAERDRPRGPPLGAYWAFGSMAVAVLLGVALSFVLVLRSLREKARVADSVLAELQSGNLKARFPVGRMDEIGMAMSRFNRMADEIERLVERMKTGERSRIALLQDLAHDLRTPVASLKSLLETLSSPKAVDPSLNEELKALAWREADYFGRLVEDLLTLAQVSEPRYQVGGEWVSVADLVDDEAETVASQATRDDRNISLNMDLPEKPVSALGDSHLLRRMLRNVFDNAFSFARSEVHISVESRSDGVVVIVVEDDGRGFSDAALESYGERRVTRAVDSSRTHRVSVGLGSVIAKTVARVHGGEVRIANRVRAGETIGARVEIRLPAAAPV